MANVVIRYALGAGMLIVVIPPVQRRYCQIFFDGRRAEAETGRCFIRIQQRLPILQCSPSEVAQFTLMPESREIKPVLVRDKFFFNALVHGKRFRLSEVGSLKLEILIMYWRNSPP